MEYFSDELAVHTVPSPTLNGRISVDSLNKNQNQANDETSPPVKSQPKSVQVDKESTIIIERDSPRNSSGPDPLSTVETLPAEIRQNANKPAILSPKPALLPKPSLKPALPPKLTVLRPSTVFSGLPQQATSR